MTFSIQTAHNNPKENNCQGGQIVISLACYKRINHMISLDKIKSIIVYFAENTNNKYLGKVKLMKLFYFLDFIHVKEYGVPVTYDTYYKLDKGPIPSYIKNIVDDACENEESSLLSDSVSFETPPGTQMKKVVANRKFTEIDKKLFSKSELNILKSVCERFSESNTNQVITISHKEASYIESEMSQVIPYELAARDSDSKFDSEEIRLSIQVTS